MPREELEQLQLERLQATLNRAYKNVAFYRKMFHESNIIPEDMQALSELARIPFTTKEDLRLNYSFAVANRIYSYLHKPVRLAELELLIARINERLEEEKARV
jgi:phenylacetate-coenzyme A ligase PaaK-like adenylate-forming protein